MTEDFQHNSMPKHMKQPRRRGKAIGITLVVCAALAAVVAAGFYAYSQGIFAHFLPQNSGISSAEEGASSTSSEGENSAASSNADAQDLSSVESETSLSDRPITAAQEKADQKRAEEEQQAAAFAAAHDGIPTPLIAEYDGVLLHSPIHASELEGILFHQASFETALIMATRLPDADPEAMLENPDYEIASEQPEGDEWLIAKALHLWREDTPTNMDTSVDVGAEAGTQVYAPVTGTVVLVSTYNLYDVVEDYEIHIQPDDRPDLDVVEIHIQDVSVKAGDKVIGGETPMAKVRDLAGEDITDIQLAFYSKEGHGNHTHVQVNNADYPEYRETRLKNAYKVS